MRPSANRADGGIAQRLPAKALGFPSFFSEAPHFFLNLLKVEVTGKFKTPPRFFSYFALSSQTQTGLTVHLGFVKKFSILYGHYRNGLQYPLGPGQKSSTTSWCISHNVTAYIGNVTYILVDAMHLRLQGLKIEKTTQNINHPRVVS
jgi:hypothetical protein